MYQNDYAQMAAHLEAGEGMVIRTVILGQSGTIAQDMTRTLAPIAVPAHGSAAVKPRFSCKDGFFHIEEPVLPPERLLILGGGHIALPLCQFAAQCGFRVFVADDRPDFANADRFPQADGVLCDSFDKAIETLRITPYDYVVIITRGHTHDADCLRTILPGTQPAYLGMIGSRRRVSGLLAALEKEGLDPERLAHINTPIGLKIGAVTPAEIAVSILAELIARRRLPDESPVPRSVADTDLEPDIVRYLAEDHDPKAIVTVVETKGSTPRGPGAKMAVSPRGQVTGSIGGGCSEGSVILDAIDIIGTGRYKLAHIDMTGEVAESEGMVCGGTMTVLIEDGTETL